MADTKKPMSWRGAAGASEQLLLDEEQKERDAIVSGLMRAGPPTVSKFPFSKPNQQGGVPPSLNKTTLSAAEKRAQIMAPKPMYNMTSEVEEEILQRRAVHLTRRCAIVPALSPEERALRNKRVSPSKQHRGSTNNSFAVCQSELRRRSCAKSGQVGCDVQPTGDADVEHSTARRATCRQCGDDSS